MNSRAGKKPGRGSVTTEKKGRSYKPLKADEIKLLLDALPLLEGNPMLLPSVTIFDYATKICRMLSSSGEFQHTAVETFDKKYGREIRRALQMTKSILAEALRHDHDIISVRKQMTHEEHWLTESEKFALDKSYTIAGTGGVIVRHDLKYWSPWESPAETISFFLSVALIHSFRKDGAGKIFIGMCPRCEKFFAKRRADQVYDRSLCQKEYTRK